MGMTVEMTLEPSLTEEQAREIHVQGGQAIVFALLAQAKSLDWSTGVGINRYKPS